MVVNGCTWPFLNVEPRRYRFRLLNGCNARFLILKVASQPQAQGTALPIWQIGADGGFLAAPAMLDQVLLAPAERADVIVDFTGLRPGTQLYLVNFGPDVPFAGGGFQPANGQTTRQVMKFVVGPLMSPDTSTPPAQLTLPTINPLTNPVNVRRLSLNERVSAIAPIPVMALLGTVDPAGLPVPLMWGDAITENPTQGTVEEWEFHNFTVDAHPIHVHLVQFQVVNRQDFTKKNGKPGAIVPPTPGETGFKDTVIAYPGQITRIRAAFDKKGRYVWHCHIIDHEDNEMMRPYEVG